MWDLIFFWFRFEFSQFLRNVEHLFIYLLTIWIYSLDKCLVMATSCEELTHWKRLWCWEGLGAGGEGDDRGWDGWMASLTRWTWVWVNSGSWWWTGRPGVLQFMGRKESDTTERLNWSEYGEGSGEEQYKGKRKWKWSRSVVSDYYGIIWAFLVAQLVKNLHASQETLVWFLIWEDPLEKGYATLSSILGHP